MRHSSSRVWVAAAVALVSSSALPAEHRTSADVWETPRNGGTRVLLAAAEADGDARPSSAAGGGLSKLRSLALGSKRTTGSGSVGATFQPGGKFGVGRCGGIEKTSLISLTSEERRTG